MNLLGKLIGISTATLALNALCAAPSQAVIDAFISESGNDILVNWSGSVSTQGLNFVNFQDLLPGEFNSVFMAVNVTGDNSSVSLYNSSTLDITEVNTLSNTEILLSTNDTSSPSGGGVGFDAGFNYVYLPRDYASNDVITGNLTIPNTDFATLGLIDGLTSSVTWDGGSDGLQRISFTTNAAGSASVPFEFSPTLGLVLAGGFFAGSRVLKRRQKSNFVK